MDVYEGKMNARFSLTSVDKMKLGVIILHFIIFVAKSKCLPCGPDGVCLCDNLNRMDCSDTHLAIRQACEFIDNITDYNVTTLRLERNGYKIIGDSDLEGCGKLYGLFLGDNNITTVEKGSLLKLDRLEILDISNNNLAIYDKTAQQKISFPLSIKTLLLNRNLNVYTSFQTGYPDLSYLINLQVLQIDGLRNKVFPVTYRKIQHLQTVILSGLKGICNVSLITNFTLQNLPYVITLNMSSCNIENIDAGAFESLTNLEILDLSQNLNLGFHMLRNISYSLQFTKIKLLNYSKVYSTFGMGTQLKTRDVCYLWNTTLTEILLNSNRIQLIETNAVILIPETLKILRAEDNKYTFGPYLLQLGCMSNLEEFYGNYQNMAHNPILYERESKENFDEFINDNSGCPFMQTEFLRNRSIGNENCHFFENDEIDIKKDWPTFPKKFKRVEFARSDMEFSIKSFPVLPPPVFFEYADFSGNILHSWIGPIGPFPNLKYLNLSRNYCSHIGLQFFDYFGSVENLQLQENFLGLVLADENRSPAIFDKLVNVKVLNLSSNIISYLPPNVFSKMLKLETLDLSVNNMETWTIDVNTLNSLLHVNLKLNFFHTFPSEFRNKLESNSERLGKQFTIDLRNNTFTTYCDEKEYLKWIVKHKNKMLYFKLYIFHDRTGAMLTVEQFVKDVDNLDKECRSYTLLIVLSSIGISVFLAIVVGGLIYKNRWKLRYLMRITKMRHFGYSKLHNDPNEAECFIYDAFISYANHDIRFILDKIIPKLEEQEMKLCLHDRDFLPGNDIADNILDAIRNSRTTVVILSKEFLKSKWCLYEFNMARMESIYSRNGANCLLVAMLENVPTTNMSTEMLDWIKSNTYIEYTSEEEGELLFWENLTDALSG